MDRHISMYDANGQPLTSEHARMLAAGLLNAADALDLLSGTG